MTRQRHTGLLHFLAVAAAAAMLLWGESIALGQLKRGAPIYGGAVTEEKTSIDDAARLNVNPKHEQLLRLADEMAREGRFDLACTVWQQLLDQGTGALMTRDQWQTETFDRAKYRRFRPVTAELQRTIAKLPAQGLGVYRASADTEARAILSAAEGNRREAALNEVVRRYFLSSLGDDAALELAGRALDRHDFVGAVRLLSQIDAVYPDPSVSRGDVLLRLAVANAYVGDIQGAQAALQRLEQLPAGRPPARLVEAVRQGAKRPAVALAPARSEGWLLKLGTAAGDGRMAALPASYTAAGLSDGWFDEFDLSPPEGAAAQQNPGIPRPSRVRMQMPMQSTAELSVMLSRWEKSTRPPAGQVLMHGGLVFYKNDNQVVCRDMRTGKLKWLGQTNDYLPSLSSIYPYYVLDQRQIQIRRSRSGLVQGQGPLSAIEIQLLMDRVHGSMSIVGDTLIAIEGADPETTPAAPAPGGGMRVIQRFPNVPGQFQLRQRENKLTARNVTTGKLKWTRSAAEKVPVNEPPAKAGFLAAPVPFANQVLVPLLENGAIWLASLDFATGKTTWRTMICEDADSGVSPWATVGVAIDGGDVYVATGAGVVAALDAISGGVHWIALYRSSKLADPQVNEPAMRHRFQPGLEPASGWQDDTVIARGSHLIVMPSDSDEILALDRRSGELQWKAARVPSSQAAASEYCLGVLGEHLYVAGPRIVRCYKIAGGGLKWEHTLTASCGRGVLTDDAIYIPDKNDVVRIDPRVNLTPNDPRELGRSPVVTPSGEPLGSLFSDGRQLLVLGPFRIYTLEGIESRLSRLGKRISEGDADARRERMRLYFQAGRLDDAMADLEGAYGGSQPKSAAALMQLLDGIEELQLAASRPVRVIELLTRARRDVANHASVSAFSSDLLRKQSAILGNALAALDANHKGGKKADVPTCLMAAELCEDEHLIVQLCQQMRSLAQSQHSELLLQSAKHRAAAVRRASAAGLGKVYSPTSRQVLVGQLKDADPHVRLAAAWELANRGEKVSLPVLVDLLQSDQALIRMRAFFTLREGTGQTLGYQPGATADARATAAEAWKKWVAGAGANVKLTFPLRETPSGLGRLLLASMGSNQVVELDAQGKETWRVPCNQPFGVHGTPDGHRLVANSSGRSIHEYDEHGKEIWTATDLGGNPSCVQRLANGNTLVVLSHPGVVMELAADQKADKKVVQKLEYGPGVGFARRLDNGNTLICLPRQSQVIELDRSNRQVRVFQASHATSVRRLENGNTLIAEQGRNRVVELSPAGEEVWSVDVQTPWDAERLPNGNTMICNPQTVEEVAPDGRKVRTLNYPSTYRISVF